MLNLEMNEAIKIHQEFINHEAILRQALRQSGLLDAPLMDRALPALGDRLISVGLKLKERSRARLMSDPSSVPTFLIML